MANKKVITLGLDYSQFDGGVTEVNRKMGMLDAQFKLTKEEMKSYATEADQLILIQEKLTQQIILQTKRVELAKEAYDKAVEGGKASDKQLDTLQKTYINSQASLQRLNNELAENKTKLDNANKSTESFGDSIRGMAGAIGINVSPALETLASKFDGVNKDVGNAVLAIGAVVTGLASCTISAAETADELLQLSSTTGITTDQLQKMQYASDFLDVEVKTITDSITKLTRNMNSARNGSSELSDAFTKLHIKYKESNGELRNSEEVFYDAIDALGKVRNETERDALAMTVFGKSAKELNPLIEAGSKRLRELGVNAEEMGLVLSGSSLENLGEFDDQMKELNKQFEGMKVKLGLILLPVLKDFLEWFNGIPTPVKAAIITFGALSIVIGLIAKAAQSMAIANTILAGTNTLVGATGTVATAGMGPLLLILLAVAAVIALIVGGAVALEGALKSAEDAGKNAINSATEVADSLLNVQANTGRSIGYANGTKNAIGGMAWVGESGPELVNIPRGSQVYTTEESKGMMGGQTNIYVTVPVDDLRQINDVVEWANNLKQRSRQGIVTLG